MSQSAMSMMRSSPPRFGSLRSGSAALPRPSRTGSSPAGARGSRHWRRPRPPRSRPASPRGRGRWSTPCSQGENSRSPRSRCARTQRRARAGRCAAGGDPGGGRRRRRRQPARLARAVDRRRGRSRRRRPRTRRRHGHRRGVRCRTAGRRSSGRTRTRTARPRTRPDATRSQARTAAPGRRTSDVQDRCSRDAWSSWRINSLYARRCNEPRMRSRTSLFAAGVLVAAAALTSCGATRLRRTAPRRPPR